MRKIFLLAFGFIASACTAQTFQNPRLVPTAHAVTTLLHGDLNGDGFDDILYDDFAVTPATLHVMLGDGHGGFAPGATIALPPYAANNCKLNTFTGSGKLDIACLVQPAAFLNYALPLEVVIFAGHGDGTFGPATTLTPTGPQYSQAVLIDAGDLNGDGVPDLVVEQAGQGIALLSNGSGGWNIGQPRNFYGIPVFTGDLNGDGKVDWVFSGPIVALGNGDGTFGPMHNYSTQLFPLFGCVLRDLDGDGHVDAACALSHTVSGTYAIGFFHGNPDGSFTYLPSNDLAFGVGSAGSYGTPIYLVDLNGDGVPDILGYGLDGLTAYYGKGGYQFGPPVHFAAGNIKNSPVSNSANWVLTDIDGDHLLDVVSGSFNGLLLTLGQSGSTFHTASAYEVNGYVGYVAVADFDSDGIPDIVSTGDIHMAISRGRGDGTFLPYKNLDTGPIQFQGLYRHSDDNLLVHGDFNGDGKEDLIAVGSDVSDSNTENEYYLQGNGDGTFQPPVSISLAPGLPYLHGLSIVADLNGDHRDDIIDKPNFLTGQITVTLSQGGGVFTTKASAVPQETYPSNNVYFFQEPFPGVADFDGDGKPDIIVGARDNAYFLHGNGDGTFSSPVSIPIPPRPNAGNAEGSVSVVAGDFDGDGRKDFAILWGTITYGVYINGPGSFGEIVVYYGKGDGTFSAPVIAAYTTADYVHIAAADLNHVGRDAIVAYASGTLDGGTDVGVLGSAANRTFSAMTPLVAGYGLANLQIADLNRDGFPDLVFSNEDYNIPANSATVLLNLGKPAVTGTLTAQPEPSLAGSAFTITASFITSDASLLSGAVTFTVDGTAVGSGFLANNSASVSVPGNYAAGAHTLSATWGGNATFDPDILIGTHNVVAVSTTVALNSSANPSVINQPLTFTALVTAANGQNPDGVVTFTDGGSPVNAPATVNVSPTGTLSVSVTTSALTVGTHSILATYVPSNAFASSSASLTQTITALTTTAVLTATPTTSTFGTPLTLTASIVSSLPGGPAITGTVTFCRTGVLNICSGTVLGSVAVAAGGTATLALPPQPAGASTFKCIYSGDAVHAPSACNAVSITVNPAPTALTLTASANPSTALTPVTFSATLMAAGKPVSTQTLTFAVDGNGLPSVLTTANGSATVFVSLSAGSHTIVVTYAATGNYSASSAQIAESATPNPTTTTLVASPAPVYQNQPLTLTASIHALSGAATPDGFVTFYDGSLPLATVTLPPFAYSGTTITATLTTSTLAPGNHALTSVYTPATPPSANFIASTSTALTIPVLPQTYTLTLADPTLTVRTEYHRTTTVTLTSIGGFNGRVSLSCGPLPDYASCNWQDATLLLPANGAVSTKLNIDTDVLLNFRSAVPAPPAPWRKSGELALAILAPLAFLRRRRRVVALLPLALVAAFGLCVAGCSSKYPGHTLPGTYVILVNGIGTSAGTATPVAQSTPLTLVVTP